MFKKTAKKTFLLALLAGIAGVAGCEPEVEQAPDQLRDTIGHKILKLEGEVLGNMNGLEKLDHIILESTKEISSARLPEIIDEETRALETFKAIARALNRFGYRHTGTYPNSLTTVLAASPPLFDCDTGSFLYLSVADELGLPVAMVEVEVPGQPSERGFGDHNFVRWKLSDGRNVDWDPNGEYQRSGDERTELYGFAWSEDELLGYIYFLRAMAWREKGNIFEAIEDYEVSIKLFSKSPKARNNLAWLLATAQDLQIPGKANRALLLAKEAVMMHPSPNHRDTLSCAYALSGQFDEAVKIQQKLKEEEQGEVFARRLKKLKKRQNCLGEK